MRNAGTSLRSLWVAAILLHPCGMLHADGGAVRLSERKGDYRITVFTSPAPLRAGSVDISVFVQDAATGEPIPEARIMVAVTPRDSPGQTLCYPATTQAATNKLFQAAGFDLPQPGWWNVAIRVEGLRQPIEVQFEAEADEPLPRIGELTPWIAWPAVVLVLFCIHQRLVQRKNKAGSHGWEPAHITLSPNQRDNN